MMTLYIVILLALLPVILIAGLSGFLIGENIYEKVRDAVRSKKEQNMMQKNAVEVENYMIEFIRSVKRSMLKLEQKNNKSYKSAEK